jgi:hypothetical protein
MIDTRRRILSIYQLAQTKLSECVQTDYNLLVVVGDTNLLSSLLTRLTDFDREMQRLDKEVHTMKTEEDGCDMDSKPILVIGKRNTPLKRRM